MAARQGLYPLIPNFYGAVVGSPCRFLVRMGRQKMGPLKSVKNWVVATQTFFIFTRILGEMLQFDEYIFQRDWNHQLENDVFFPLQIRTGKVKGGVFLLPRGFRCDDEVIFTGGERAFFCGWVEMIGQTNLDLIRRNLNKKHVFIISIWVFPKMVAPPKHPKMIIFTRKTNGCWVPTCRKPPYSHLALL